MAYVYFAAVFHQLMRSTQCQAEFFVDVVAVDAVALIVVVVVVVVVAHTLFKRRNRMNNTKTEKSKKISSPSQSRQYWEKKSFFPLFICVR